jgi:hypothetical protein
VSGKRAKLIRKAIYGDTYSPRHRSYVDRVNPHKPHTEVRHAGAMRELYQKSKRIWYATGEMPR